jgi:hypothetical protein
MAHFAQLDEHNKVVNVIVIQNDLIVDENGNESEELGIERCKLYTDPNARWIQTSYNNNFRGKLASIDGYYIEDLDVFSYPKLYNSWVFNQETLNWDPPVAKPEDAPAGQYYVWNENVVNWELYPPVAMPEDAPEGFYYQWNPEIESWELIEIPQPVGIATT